MGATGLEQVLVERTDGWWATRANPRQLGELLQMLAGSGRSLGGVRLSRAGFSRVLEMEPRSGLVRVEAGITLQALEASVRERQLTLGPVAPVVLALSLAQFLEGPWAGLRAIPPGRLEPICQAVTGMSASGRVFSTPESPRSAAGPDLMGLVLGAGGRLGLVTSAVVRCLPLVPRAASWAFSFAAVGPLVASAKAALADGCWVSSASIERRAERWVVRVEPFGAPDRVLRDRTSWEKRVFQAGGRPKGADSEELRLGDDSPVPGPWVEAGWPAVAKAAENGQPLGLYRLSLGSVVVQGQCEGRPLEGPVVSAAGLERVLDPRGVLSGTIVPESSGV